jgi:hypothetical protein
MKSWYSNSDDIELKDGSRKNTRLCLKQIQKNSKTKLKNSSSV